MIFISFLVCKGSPKRKNLTTEAARFNRVDAYGYRLELKYSTSGSRLEGPQSVSVGRECSLFFMEAS